MAKRRSERSATTDRGKTMLAEPIISLRGLRVAYGANEVLKGIDLAITPGSFVALLGPSGCGKTTLLRTLSGFTPACGGSITVNGRDIQDEPPERLGWGVLLHEARFDRLKDRVGVREATGVADTAATLPGAISLGRTQRVGRIGRSGLPGPNPAPTLPRDAAGAAIELFGNCRTTQSHLAKRANNRQFLRLEVCVCLHQ